MGPAIVTTDEIADPHALDVQLSIDGEVLQHSNTRGTDLQDSGIDRIHLVDHRRCCRGTSCPLERHLAWALGATRSAGLKAGETVTIAIEGLGELTNPVTGA